MRVCSSLTMIGTGEGPGLRLGWFLVVRGAGGSGVELADSVPLSVLLDIRLPQDRVCLVATADLDLLPSRL